MCGIAACDAFFGDCDRLAPGCETDLRTDATNCGVCGNACPNGAVCVNAGCTCAPCNLPNAKAQCVNFQCVVGGCNPGFGDCDGVAGNGCEVLLNSDVNHCGACKTACAVANGTPGCAMGSCVVQSCKLGFGDCDGLYQTGCETDLTADATNCGACGVVCPQGQACSAGKCVVVGGCGFNMVGSFMALVPAPTHLDFCGVMVGAMSKAQAITFTNTGGVQLAITSITVDGTNAKDFILDVGFFQPPFAIGAGVSFNLSVVFAPIAAGPRSAQVTIALQNQKPTTAPIGGTGL
jgi:hypothetical protein